MTAIKATGLHKSYGSTAVLDGIDLDVAAVLRLGEAPAGPPAGPLRPDRRPAAAATGSRGYRKPRRRVRTRTSDWFCDRVPRAARVRAACTAEARPPTLKVPV